MNVGVRELKQHLSEYLRRVGEGETLQVTDRGVPVALISPVVGPDPLRRAIDDGLVRPPTAPGRVGHHPLEKGRRHVLEVLDEDRAE